MNIGSSMGQEKNKNAKKFYSRPDFIRPETQEREKNKSAKKFQTRFYNLHVNW